MSKDKKRKKLEDLKQNIAEKDEKIELTKLVIRKMDKMHEEEERKDEQQEAEDLLNDAL